MKDVIILKTNILGGFDKRETSDCIARLQAEIKKYDRTKEMIKAKETVKNRNAAIVDKERQIEELCAKLNELSSPHAKAEGAREFLRSVPNSSLDKLLKNDGVREAYHSLNSALSADSEFADTILSRIACVNDDIQSIMKNLSQVSQRLDGVKLNDNKPEIAPETNEAPCVEQENAAEFEKITDDSQIIKAIDKVTADEEHEPLFENSVDNFFAELERFTNK